MPSPTNISELRSFLGMTMDKKEKRKEKKK